jgi:hypothetical protein
LDDMAKVRALPLEPGRTLYSSAAAEDFPQHVEVHPGAVGTVRSGRDPEGLRALPGGLGEDPPALVPPGHQLTLWGGIDWI